MYYARAGVKDGRAGHRAEGGHQTDFGVYEILLSNTVRSLIKLNAAVTSRLPAGTVKKKFVDFVVFMERYLTHIGKTL
jgi:hypothetical protein